MINRSIKWSRSPSKLFRSLVSSRCGLRFADQFTVNSLATHAFPIREHVLILVVHGVILCTHCDRNRLDLFSQRETSCTLLCANLAWVHWWNDATTCALVCVERMIGLNVTSQAPLVIAVVSFFSCPFHSFAHTHTHHPCVCRHACTTHATPLPLPITARWGPSISHASIRGHFDTLHVHFGMLKISSSWSRTWAIGHVLNWPAIFRAIGRRDKYKVMVLIIDYTFR